MIDGSYEIRLIWFLFLSELFVIKY